MFIHSIKGQTGGVVSIYDLYYDSYRDSFVYNCIIRLSNWDGQSHGTALLTSREKWQGIRSLPKEFQTVSSGTKARLTEGSGHLEAIQGRSALYSYCYLLETGVDMNIRLHQLPYII